jgi:hypothetical protein
MNSCVCIKKDAERQGKEGVEAWRWRKGRMNRVSKAEGSAPPGALEGDSRLKCEETGSLGQASSSQSEVSAPQAFLSIDLEGGI